jgi:hypothetical protein
MWDKDGVIEKWRDLSSATMMNTRRDAPRQLREEAPVSAGRFRDGHKASLKKIWDERPCLPSVASRKAWASARGLDPTSVNRWFYAQLRKAKASGFVLDTKNEGYDLGVNGGSPVSGLAPSTPRGRESVLHSTTPEGLPELSCYEYSTSIETGLRIPLSPGQSSSPIFGSSFYSPELALGPSSDAGGHLAGLERFLVTPPSPLKRKRTVRSCSRSQNFVEEPKTETHQSMAPLPVTPTPHNRLPPSPLAPKKRRLSRGSHGALSFRTQNDYHLRFSPPTSSPTRRQSGYSVPYHMDPREREGGDGPKLTAFSDLHEIVAKTSRAWRMTDQKQGG